MSVKMIKLIKKAEIVFKENIAKYFNEFSRSATLNAYERAKRNVLVMKREFRECDNEEEKKYLEEEIKENQ